MVKIKKNLLLITTVLLPLSAFAKKWAFCPTSGSLNFDMQASKSSASVKMRKPTERTVKYVDTNLPIQQTSNVTCINIYTDVIPLYKSSILTWITDNNSQVPMTPEYASASQYFNANVNKNINADQFAINTPNSLMVGVVGKLTYSVSGNTYSCQNVFIGIGGSSIGGYNWWVFNNNTSSPAHSLSCTDQAGNLVTLFLGTNSNNISYWAVDQQDYVMTFGTSASLENSYQTLSYQYIS